MENNIERDIFELRNFELEEIDEYIVTLKNKEDLESFYDDMETHGGTECVPDRCVECAARRTISRNTHYYLNQEEVENLKKDDRVLDIIPKKLKDSIVIVPLGWTQSSSNWDKTDTVVNTHRNWGLRRCIDGTQTSNWGSNGTTSISGSVTTTSSGKNVDVVIADGFINPDHPEMAKNEDGTGGTRVVQFNWHSLTSYLGFGSNGTYNYPATYTNYGDDHGMHVAGTAVGNSQGWARDANVYNLYVYGDGQTAGNNPFDYVRAFHLTKAINPETGLRNPTIMNNSWGASLSLQKSSISSVIWRGTTYSGSPTNAQLISYGLIYGNATIISIRYWSAADEADVQDAIDDGVIIVGAAGNEYTKIDVPGGQDYNNRVVLGSNQYYYHRGSVFTSAGNAICVGAVSNLVNESKADFSNSGPRITIYSPGESILSSVHNGQATDFRNSNYEIDKYPGTSMASPQVCGVIACALEQYPRMTHAEAVEYIQTAAKINQMTTTSGGYTDVTDLQGSTNRYLFYKKDRPETGITQPKDIAKTRPASGQVYPRKPVLHYKK